MGIGGGAGSHGSSSMATAKKLSCRNLFLTGSRGLPATVIGGASNKAIILRPQRRIPSHEMSGKVGKSYCETRGARAIS